MIGYGSIGQRHARLLTDAGCAVTVVSRRAVAEHTSCRQLEDAVDGDADAYVVVANETSAHRDAVTRLAAAGCRGTVLIEKPIFDQPFAVPENQFRHLAVAYNLRFHPVLQRLSQLLADDPAISTSIYVGQYLPDWRPATDYRTSYSAHRAAGGGVLRDLSHELDYVGWLLGAWRSVAALGGHFSTLDIDSDDVFALLLETERCPVVTVQLSYLDRTSRRQILVNTQRHTIAADLVANSLTIDGRQEIFPVERDTTYRSMHDALLAGRTAGACDAAAATDVMQLIDAAERSANGAGRVHR